VIVGWWTGFPFWQSFPICVSGGVLVHHPADALVTTSDPPYPGRCGCGSVAGRFARVARPRTTPARWKAHRRDFDRSLGLRDSLRRASPRRSPDSSESAHGVERVQCRGRLRCSVRVISCIVGRRCSWVFASRGSLRFDSDVDAPRPQAPCSRRTPRSTQEVRFIGAGVGIAAIYTLAFLRSRLLAVIDACRVEGCRHQ
jgi:hypothetical protein